MDLVSVDIADVLASIRALQGVDGKGALMALHSCLETLAFSRRPGFQPAHNCVFFGHITRQGHALCFIARHNNVIFLVQKGNWRLLNVKKSSSEVKTTVCKTREML